MFTRNDALLFLKNNLHIENGEEIYEEDRLKLLGEIIRGFHAYVPYQNFRLLATDADERHVLTEESMIEDCSSGMGGTCHVLNTFLCLLLRTLGYDATLQGCTMAVLPQIPYHHLVNFIKGVNDPHDWYLMDPAAWYPTFEVVSLHDLNENPKTYKSAFHEYKFVREGDRIYRRHRKGKVSDHSIGKIDEQWNEYYSFPIEPVPVEDINECMEGTYKEHTSGILKMIFLSFYPLGKGITVSGNTVRIYTEATQNLETLKYSSPQGLFDILSPYWGSLKLDMVERAHKNLLIELEYQKANKKE